MASKLLCCVSADQGPNGGNFRRGYVDDDRPMERNNEDGNITGEGSGVATEQSRAGASSYEANEAVGKLTTFFGAVAAMPVEAVGMKPFWRKGFVELDDGDDLEENRPKCCGLAYPRNREECKSLTWQLLALVLVFWNLYIIVSVLDYTWFPHN